MMPDFASLIKPDAFQKLPNLLKVMPGDPEKTIRAKRILQFLATLTVIGAIAGIIAFIFGHHSHGTYSELPWGALIATYVFFVVSSTGLCLVSSLGHVFGIKLFEPIAKKAIFFALLTLLIGFAVIATELERPLLLGLMAVISPNIAAPIWWMGALYGIYMVLIATELYFLIREDHHKARTFGLLSVIAAITAHSNLGAVFGLNYARPYWYGPLMPVYFIASALLCGAAILILIVYFSDYYENQDGGGALHQKNVKLVEILGKLLALFIGVILFATIWKLITALYGSHHHKYDVVREILFGRLSLSYWGFETLVGMIIPLWILIGRRRHDPRQIAIAAGATMIGVFFMRYNFVYAGQMFSLKPVIGHEGETFNYLPLFKGSLTGFLDYTPSIIEMLIVIGAISAAILGYVVGSRILKVESEAEA